MNKLIISIVLIILSSVSYAQSLKITGTVTDKKENLPLTGANIVVSDTIKKTDPKGTTADKDGKFVYNASKGTYKVKISFIGYIPHEEIITLDKKDINLGKISLREDSEMLGEVNVVEDTPATIQKGDTTQFNAVAYKTDPDASAKEMMMKMPGFMMIDGKIVFQGQEIKEVLIDGRQFFGKDAINALTNIPVDIIKSIKVYEYQSEQAKFTGFKDFTQAKTVNIITKDGFHNLTFGNAGISAGTNNEFSGDASLNMFAGKRRMSGDIRASQYKSDDHRTESNSKSIGAYYNEQVSEKSEIGGNYSYRNNSNKNFSESTKEYIASELKGQKYIQNGNSDSKGNNHNFSLRWDYDIDERNSILFMPSGSFSDRESSNRSSSKTYEGEKAVNMSENISSNSSDNLNLSNTIMYFHRFEKKGRTLSADISYNTSDNDSKGLQNSVTGLPEDENRTEINQNREGNSKNTSFSANISFTEKISDKIMARLSYVSAYDNNTSEQRSYNVGKDGEVSEVIDKQTSRDNKYINRNNELAAGLQYRTKKFSMSLDSRYRNTYRKNRERYPEADETAITYNQFMPSMRFRYSLAKNKSINFDYNSNVSNPSARQLQSVLDNSNPLFLSTGNPDLDKSRSHSFNFRYSSSNMEKNTYFSVGSSLGFTQNSIGNNTIYAKNDTLINGSVKLVKGGQFSQPVNMNGQMSFSTNANYAMPLKFIKSRLNLNTSLGYNRSPNIVNSKKSFSNNYNISQGVTLASNISDKLDFNLSSRTGLSILENNTNNSNTKRFTQSSSLRFYANPVGKLVARTSLSNHINNDLKGDYYVSNWTWDVSVGTKLFKHRQGEITLTAKDILNDKSNVYHTVTEMYIQDSKRSVVNRYFYLRFTYRFR